MPKNSISQFGIDWGSSSFRVYRYDEHQKLVDSVESEAGIKTISNSAFEEYLFSAIGHWLQPGDTVLLSGMITSRNGWIETPYLPVPVAPKRLLDKAIKRRVRDIDLVFLPGMSQTHPRNDVVRGEELQLFGATQTKQNALVVLPGTHSKWARINNGEVTGFQTIATGELFDVLLNKTLIGQLATEKSLYEAIFKQGVQKGFATNKIISELFQCRSGVLLNQFAEHEVYSYLSGLLIGNEISEGLPERYKDQGPIVLVGSDALCKNYQLAFDCLRIDAVRAGTNTTPEAFARLLALYETQC